VRFWDSSAVIPLLVPEMMSASMQSLFASDPVIIAWWATDIECTSAIARRLRSRQLRDDMLQMASAV